MFYPDSDVFVNSVAVTETHFFIAITLTINSKTPPKICTLKSELVG